MVSENIRAHYKIRNARQQCHCLVCFGDWSGCASTAGGVALLEEGLMQGTDCGLVAFVAYHKLYIDVTHGRMAGNRGNTVVHQGQYALAQRRVGIEQGANH